MYTQPSVLILGHESLQRSSNGTCRLHRLSTLRFILKGNEVSRVLIHLLSQILCRQESWLCTWLMAITVMSAWECSSMLKCAATGESSVLLCVMSKWWPLILQWKGCPVLPTYCWPHLLHVIKYYTGGLAGGPYFHFKLLPSRMAGEHIRGRQYRTGFTLTCSSPHGQLPGSSYEVDVKEARTRRSLRFFRRWKAIRGGDKNALRSRSETWRMEWCWLVVQQPLHCRINSHSFDIMHMRTEDSPVAAHFNIDAHSQADMTVMVINQVHSHDSCLRKIRESRWIRTLETSFPLGNEPQGR